MTSKIELKKVEVINGRIKGSNYVENAVKAARHIYEAHEYAAKALGFSCGAEMDDYLRRLDIQ